MSRDAAAATDTDTFGGGTQITQGGGREVTEQGEEETGVEDFKKMDRTSLSTTRCLTEGRLFR